MNPIWYMAFTLVSVALVQSKKECQTSLTTPANNCTYDSSISGAANTFITYTLYTAADTEICCDAFECTVQHCEFHDIGCGQGIWQSKALLWEVEQEPITRCQRDQNEVSYSYTVSTHVQVEPMGL